ncbi:twinkle mtDNA helicase-like [Ornithodoros turicata]|uniref:twinkle mtDNA helicase-like n=1 Tax=Ornithodoros turicata TaxID=34597 RepID=UPI003138C21E
MAAKLLRYCHSIAKCYDGVTQENLKRSPLSNLTYLRYRHFMTQIKRIHPRPGRREILRFYVTSLGSGDDIPVVTVSKIKRVLKEKLIGFEEGYTCLKVTCPVCQLKDHGSKVPSASVPKPEAAFINVVTGLFTCYSCQVVASWQELQDFLSVESGSEGAKLDPRQILSPASRIFPTTEELVQVEAEYSSSLPLADLEQLELSHLLKRFHLQKIQPLTLKLLDVRLAPDSSHILFPIYGPTRTMVALKRISDAGGMLEETITPRAGLVGVFGWQKVRKNHQEVILTTSEADAVAVFQEANMPVVSLLTGTSSLPLEALPLFEQFRKITIWFGNKVQDWESAKTFSRKLGEKRCFYIRPSEGYPLSALQSGHASMVSILRTSQPVAHKAITTFHSLRARVADILHNADVAAGVKWQRFPALTRLLKGFRRGELTVFTGPTGSGKTTLMCEYSLDLCMQGVHTLWGSFEIQNERLAKIMLTQFSLISLEKHLGEFDAWADKFELLPLYFMTFHGEQSIRNVLDAMSHAVYVHDIQHVIVDNIQFMMGVNEESARMDRFWKQDLLVAAFRKFATQHNCHVTLVMHPRKERDQEELSTSSIFGGAKASQEADNVLILQDKRLSSVRGRKHLQVSKNRYDGDIGMMPLEFNKENLTFSGRKHTSRKTVEPQSGTAPS